jgi:hypothetical protein
VIKVTDCWLRIPFDHKAGENICRLRKDTKMTAALKLISIECVNDNEWFGDEPFLNFNGGKIWSGGMGTGDTKSLAGMDPIVFNGAADVSLFEEDLGFWPDQDDYLGSFTVTEAQASDGVFAIDFTADGHYRVFVDVMQASFV